MTTDNMFSNGALDVIFSRKSVRHFTDQKVEREKIETMLKAGMAAPSSKNSQPWSFVVVEDQDVMIYLSENLPYAKMLKSASAAVVVCGDIAKATPNHDKSYWTQDCSAATQNILLAAESLGLGAVWTAVYPYDDRVELVSKKLGLPQNIIPLNVIPVGYPTGQDHVRDKWNPENIHWEKW